VAEGASPILTDPDDTLRVERSSRTVQTLQIRPGRETGAERPVTSTAAVRAARVQRPPVTDRPGWISTMGIKRTSDEGASPEGTRRRSVIGSTAVRSDTPKRDGGADAEPLALVPSETTPPSKQDPPSPPSFTPEAVAPPGDADGMSRTAGPASPQVTSGGGDDSAVHVSEAAPLEATPNGNGAAHVAEATSPPVTANGNGNGAVHVAEATSPPVTANGNGAVHVAEATSPPVTAIGNGNGAVHVAEADSPPATANGKGSSRVAQAASPQAMPTGNGTIQLREAAPEAPRESASGGNATAQVAEAATASDRESTSRDIGPSPPLSVRPGTGAASELTRARIEVANGAGRRHMARRVGSYLRSQNTRVWWIRNDRSFDNAESVVYYRPGFESEAQALAAYFRPVDIDTQSADAQQADLRLRLGRDMLDYDLKLIADSWRPHT